MRSYLQGWRLSLWLRGLRGRDRSLRQPIRSACARAATVERPQRLPLLSRVGSQSWPRVPPFLASLGIRSRPEQRLISVIRWAYRRRRSEITNRRARLQIRTLPTAVVCAPFRRTCRIMRWGPDDGFDLRKFTHAAGSRRCIRHRFLHATAQLFHRTAATRLQGPLLVLLPSSGWRWWLRICRGLPRKHRNLSGLSSSLSSSFDLRTNRAAKADVRIRRRGRQGGLSKDTTTKIRGPCCVVKEIVLTRSS